MYNRYEIIRIDAVENVVKVKFESDTLPTYYDQQYYDPAIGLSEEILAEIISNLQMKATKYASKLEEAVEFTPESMTGDLKELTLVDLPEFNPLYQKVVETWEETETTKTQVLTVEDLTDSDKAAFIRQKRNILLADTDIEALGDRTMSTEMQDYRAALRNITDQETFPQSVIWPILPIG